MFAASLRSPHLPAFLILCWHIAASGPGKVGGASVACWPLFGPTLLIAVVAQEDAQPDCRGVPLPGSSSSRSDAAARQPAIQSLGIMRMGVRWLAVVAFVAVTANASELAESMAICLDGPGKPCTPVSGPDEARKLSLQRAARAKKAAEELKVDYVEIVYTALADSTHSTPYCLSVFGQPPPERLKDRLVATGHALLDCGGKGQRVRWVDAVEEVAPDLYRVHIGSSCGVGGMCSSAHWYFILVENNRLFIQRTGLDWIT